MKKPDPGLVLGILLGVMCGQATYANPNGAQIAHGQVNITNSNCANGDIFLITPNIENSGIIETDGGHIILVVGESITIASLDSDHSVFQIQAPEN